MDLRSQFTQGIPFFAITAPPCGPVVGMTTDGDSGPLEALALGPPAVALGPVTVGVAGAPAVVRPWP